MTNAASALGSEYDAFLFAPIGWDQNEMALSVVSALARLDIDPWREAAKLARLSQAAAASRLAGLLADLPTGTPARLDPDGSPARLVALLPRGHASQSPASRIVRDTTTVPNYRVIAFIIFAVFIFSVQYVMAGRPPPPPRAEQASGAPTATHAKAVPKSAP
jgi:hypothetical protein